MEFFSTVSYIRTLWKDSVPDTAVFYGLLEFHEDCFLYSCRTVCDCGSGGMGVCGIPVSVPEMVVYPVYCADADAFSGDDAVQLSGA